MLQCATQLTSFESSLTAGRISPGVLSGILAGAHTGGPDDQNLFPGTGLAYGTYEISVCLSTRRVCRTPAAELPRAVNLWH